MLFSSGCHFPRRIMEEFSLSLTIHGTVISILLILSMFSVLQGTSSEGNLDNISSPFWIYRGSCLANCVKDRPTNTSSCLTWEGCPQTAEEYEHICDTDGCGVDQSCHGVEEGPDMVLKTFSRYLKISWDTPDDTPSVTLYQNDYEEVEVTLSSYLQQMNYAAEKVTLIHFTFAECGLIWSEEVIDCGNLPVFHEVVNTTLRVWMSEVNCNRDNKPFTFYDEDSSELVEVPIIGGLGAYNECSATAFPNCRYCDFPSMVNLTLTESDTDKPSIQNLSYELWIDQLTFALEDRTLNVSWPDCPPSSAPLQLVYLHHGILRHEELNNFFDDNEFTPLPAGSTSHVLSNLTADVMYGFQVFCVYDMSYINFIKSNYKIWQYDRFKLDPTVPPPLPSTDERTSTLLYQILGIMGGVVAICLVMLLVCLLYHGRKSTKNKIRRMEQSIQNVYDDHPSRTTSRKSSATSNQLTLSDFHKSVMLSDHWEFDPKRLKLGSSLGKGAFGQVVEGFLEGRVCVRQCLKSGWEWVPQDTGKKEITRVAVKLLKDFASDAQKQDFLQEIQMMKYLGYHPNVVCLIGCCTVMDPVCLVVESCPDGDLKKFLLNSRNKILMRLKEENLEVDDLLTAADLLSFARQVTMGMEYLSQKGYVHRDLAARNILVANDKSVKIADFGLTRYIYEERQYVGKKGARIPVKWMSVEAIVDGVFTTESDIWSFGVILYEIITLGGEPYPGINNKDLAKMLCSGFRMERPEQCPDDLYTMMLDCWHESPNQRPSFTKLRLQLEAMLEANTPYLSLYPSQAHIFNCLNEIREESDENQSASEDEPMLDTESIKSEGSRQPSPLRLAISQSEHKPDQHAADSDDSVLVGDDSSKQEDGSSEYINAGRQAKGNEMVLSLLSSPDSCDSGVAIDTRFFYDSKGSVLEYEGDEQMV